MDTPIRKIATETVETRDGLEGYRSLVLSETVVYTELVRRGLAEPGLSLEAWREKIRVARQTREGTHRSLGLR